MRPVVWIWIVLSGLLTLGALAGYAVVQQALRTAADHPQVEMARAAAARLSAGASPQSVVPSSPIDIGSSSATYLIVLDPSGTPLASSALLNGSAVTPPSGVFAYVRDRGEDMISWQPAPGVRSAIVVDSFSGGYVVAGRSLQWTEQAESELGFWAIGAWVVAMVLAGGLFLFVPRLLESRKA